MSIIRLQDIRRAIQIAFTALSNGYVVGFIRGNIYQGKAKKVCLPGLSCYSCPGALGSCPLGSLQAVLSSPDHKISAYVVGYLLVIGALAGRLVCGWLCPFGLIQDIIYKIPILKKIKNLRGHRYWIMIKYILLLATVILMPLIIVDFIGQGSPWFCKLVCPSGTIMAGWPLVILNSNIRGVIGWLFAWKSIVLIVIIILSLKVYRPFCKYLCPLGAIYGFFNPIALHRYKIDIDTCTKCATCHRACPMDIEVYKIPNSMECIRCGRCKQACPVDSIKNVKLTHC